MLSSVCESRVMENGLSSETVCEMNDYFFPKTGSRFEALGCTTPTQNLNKTYPSPSHSIDTQLHRIGRLALLRQ